MLYPLKLQTPLKDYIWGGTRLKDEYNKQTDLPIVAESWELACHQDGMNTIENGCCQGMTLADYIKKCGNTVVGTKAMGLTYFPLMIKLIDAHRDLSIQVHPNDAYAQTVENEPNGKTEMWYVIDAQPDAELIYGFNKEITRAEFEEHITNGTLPGVCRHVPVKKGDVFFIPASTLHAIGKGILLAEIQQNSNLTYRVYDYERKGKDGKPRQLHIAKALTVTNLQESKYQEVSADCIDVLSDYRLRVLCRCSLFCVYLFKIAGNCLLHADAKSFHSLILLSGEICLATPQESLILKSGDSVFIPADMGDYHINGVGEFILTTM